jgi:large subunit ribosomal protein L2
MLTPRRIKEGDTVISGEKCEPTVGNAMQLGNIPSGIEVHNIEMNPGQGGKIARGAGNSARLVAKEGKWVTLVLPSGEMRMINSKCKATIGQLSNADYQNIRWGKAGRRRYLGRRPHVRGKAQNPVSHPLGGGEGRSNGGRHPCSPTGVLAKGGKTRKRRKNSSKWIIRRRRNKRQGVVSL